MQTNINATVGQNLKNARIAKGMTQKEVAAILNKYQPDYSNGVQKRSALSVRSAFRSSDHFMKARNAL